jgi:lysophospholipase L1-like esterase
VSLAYVALGDSYAAGVGAGERQSWSYRTDAGYPLTVARESGLELAYQAVLGATTDDVLRDQVVAVGEETRLVTVTVGGNDVGFVPILLEVVRPAWASDSEAAITAAMTLASEILPGRVRDVVREVRRRAPAADVVVTGYPRLFNEISDCSWLTFVTVPEMRLLGTAADHLAELILGVAADEGCEPLDVRGPFDGHQICDPEEWVNGLSWPTEESYHPNPLGHAAYGRLVAEAAVRAAGRQEATAEPPPCVEGRCVGTAPTFALPDLLSPRSLQGAAAHGLDVERITALGRRVQDETRPEPERREAAAELREMSDRVARR